MCWKEFWVKLNFGHKKVWVQKLWVQEKKINRCLVDILEGVRMVYGGSLEVRAGQVRTSQVKSEQIKAGLVQLGLVKSGQIKSD